MTDKNNRSVLSNENRTTKNQNHKSINFSANKKSNILHSNNLKVNKSVDKGNNDRIPGKSSNKIFSKTKKSNNNNSTNFNSREDKNYVRRIFNNLNQNTDYDEKISFINNFATVKVSTTCVSTKNASNKEKDKDSKNGFAAESSGANNDFNLSNYDYLNANNTKNALTNYSYFNNKK